MSLLPQRKKSAEEIAKLRESLGVGGPPPTDEAAPAPEVVSVPEPAATTAAPPAVAEEESQAAVPALAPLPAKGVAAIVPPAGKPGKIPVLPIEESGPPPAHPSEPRKMETATPLPVAPAPPRVVRSLKKSEQGPLQELPPPPPDSKLPIHRHDSRELQDIRRREVIAMTATAQPPPVLSAHPVLIVPGYLFAAIAAGSFLWFEFGQPVTFGCAAAAIACAAFIFVRKPLSRHHAAFIAAAVLFVIVFGALHYYPSLRHGT